MLLKTFLRLYFENNAQFLGHTGDGACVLIENNWVQIKKDCMILLYMAEKLKKYAVEKRLIYVTDANFSLIHIGIAYGK